MKKQHIVVFVGACIIVSIVIWLIINFYKAYSPKPQQLQGQIQAREYKVSSKVAGRIESILVKRGDFVKKGDLIFTIESPELQAKLTQAQAGYEAAKALSQEAHKGARIETILSAKDMYNSAKAMRELTENTYKRIDDLYNKGVASLQKRDEAYTAYQNAKYNESTAYQQYKIALDGATQETKEAAKQKEIAAAGQLSEVEAYIQDIQAYAPADGEVSNVLLAEGELSPTGFPVVMLVDTKDVWLRVAVSEEYLKDFQKNSEFSAFIPALQKEIRFKVQYVSVMGDFATWRATSSSKGYDLRSFEIQAVPLQNDVEFAVGMSAIITLPPQTH
ncbi:HlyD family secretion protein [uncultured Helicobacter sp.]|uniref:HlyD family secretion protein n=1 Tax=uncultured Helicobacter sp. TaxID=175537 RepID=UPI00374F3E3F